MKWQNAESTVCRIVHRIEHALIDSGQFRLPVKKALFKGFDPPEIVVMDVKKEYQEWLVSSCSRLEFLENYQSFWVLPSQTHFVPCRLSEQGDRRRHLPCHYY